MEIIFTAETYQTAGNLFIQAKQEIDIGIKAVAKNDYGEEFKSMAVIPIIMPKDLHEQFRERRLIKRKTFEADIRLFVDFEKFVKGKWDVKKEPYRTERKLLLVKNREPYALCRDLAPRQDRSGKRRGPKNFSKNFQEKCVKMSLRNRLIYRGSYALCRDLALGKDRSGKRCGKDRKRSKIFSNFMIVSVRNFHPVFLIFIYLHN